MSSSLVVSNTFNQSGTTTFEDILIREIFEFIFNSKRRLINSNYHNSFCILNFKDLANFSLVSKKCYQIAHSIDTFKLIKYYLNFSLSYYSLCNDDYFANLYEHFDTNRTQNSFNKSYFYRTFIKNITTQKYYDYLQKILYWSNNWSNNWQNHCSNNLAGNLP